MADQDDGTATDLGDVFRRVSAELTAFYDELEKGSPRAAAVLAVTALEDALEDLLRTKFPEATDAEWKHIAGPGSTPFGSMKAKRNVAKAFGFFGPKTGTAIQRIAQVRNKFAHRKDVRDFDHPDVLKICRDLSDNPIYRYTLNESALPSDVRWLFLHVVKDLTDRLNDIRWSILELSDKEPAPLP